MAAHENKMMNDMLLRERANQTVTDYVGTTDYRVVLEDIREEFPEAFNMSTVENLSMEPETYLKSKLAAAETRRVPIKSKKLKAKP